jgi:adenylate cyclase
MRLSPLDPLGYVFALGMAIALITLGRYDEALEWADRSLHDHPDYVAALRNKIVSLVHLDRIDEARHTLQRLIELIPHLTIATLTQMTPGGLAAAGGEQYLEAFRKAGLPEE